MSAPTPPGRPGVPRLALITSGLVVIVAGIVVAATISVPIGLAIVAVEALSLPVMLRVVAGSARQTDAGGTRQPAASDAARAFGAED